MVVNLERLLGDVLAGARHRGLDDRRGVDDLVDGQVAVGCPDDVLDVDLKAATLRATAALAPRDHAAPHPAAGLDSIDRLGELAPVGEDEAQSARACGAERSAEPEGAPVAVSSLVAR